MSVLMIAERTLWKEYRTLRSAWILCGLGGALLFGIFRAMMAYYQAEPGYSALFWALTVWFPPVFVFTGTAVAFSGEREERTLDWLTALAPPVFPVIATKILFVLLAGGTLTGWLALVSAACSLGDSQRDFPIDANFAWTIVFCLLESLVWGTFWSLQVTRPLTSILLAASSIVVVNLGSIALAESLGLRPQEVGLGGSGGLGFFGWVRCLLTAAVFAMSIGLARNWLVGQPWDWQGVQHWWSSLRRTRAVIVDESETLSDPEQRALQRLNWLEMQSLIPVARVLTFVTLTVIGAILAFGHFGAALATCLLWIIPLLTGLLAWRADQHQQHFRFLVGANVVPATYWWRKLLLWSGSGALAIILLGALTIVAWELRCILLRNPSLHSLIESLSNSRVNEPAVFDGVPSLLLIAFVTLFSLGFTWSHLARKAVIAFGGALLSALTLIPWFLLVTGCAMPFWLFLAPIPAWLLMISRRHLPEWWLERFDRRVVVSRAVEIVVFPVLLGLGAIAYRVYEIPSAASQLAAILPTPQQNPQVNANIDAWKWVIADVRKLSFDNRLSASKLGFGPPGAELAISHAESGPVSATMPENSQEGNDQRISPEWIKARRSSLESLRDQLLRTPTLLPEAAIWEELLDQTLNEKARIAIQAMTQLAVIEFDPEAPEHSLQWLQASARLSGARAAFAPPSLGIHLLGRDGGWRSELDQWVRHPRQTITTLSRGLQILAGELRLVDVTSIALANDRDRELMPPRSEPQELFWEQARWERLLDVELANRIHYLTLVDQGKLRPTLRPERFVASGDRTWNLRIPSRFPGHPHRHESQVVGLDFHSLNIMFHSRCRGNLLVTRLALQGYRHIHGELPTSLWKLKDLLGSQRQVLVDPWTHELFRYEPDGFPAQAIVAERHPDLGGPFVWSPGPLHYVLSASTPATFVSTEGLSEVVVHNRGQIPVAVEFLPRE